MRRIVAGVWRSRSGGAWDCWAGNRDGTRRFHSSLGLRKQRDVSQRFRNQVLDRPNDHCFSPDSSESKFYCVFCLAFHL